MTKGSVSVIIPNWNGERFLQACLGSLSRQTYKNYEVTLVDNASSDGSLALVRSQFPEVKIVALSENRGFAYAINEGIRCCDGEYIALLNNDAQVDHRWLDELAGALELHAEAGACASKMLRLPDTHIIDGAGDEYSRYGVAFRAGQGETDAGQYDSPREVFGACAGAAIYRRAVLEEAQFFDEDFFMYYEDVDMDFAIQLMGYKVVYVPTAMAYHVGHPNIDRSRFLFIQRLSTRNSLNVMIKNFPLTLALRLSPRLFEGHLRRTMGSVARGWFQSHLLGWLDAMRLMPRMLKKRRARMALRRVSNQYLLGMMKTCYPVAASAPTLPSRKVDPRVDVSVVIVNWNTKAALKKCLESVYASDFESFEVIVVDNGSTDGSTSMLEQQFPQVKIVRNIRNGGFARGSNQGIFLGQGNYILLLNSDAWVEEHTLNNMVQFMEQCPKAGAIGPRLILPDGSPQPYSYGADPTLAYLLKRAFIMLLRKGYLHDWETDAVQEVDWVSGASLMVRRKALEAAGLLDENFSLYFEDNDLCLRMRQNNWQVYYVPTIEVVHRGGESLAKNAPARAEYYYSLVYFYAKHYGKAAFLLTLLLLPYRLLARLGARGGSGS